MPSGPVRVSAPPGGARGPTRPLAAPASIAPVGLEVAADADYVEEVLDERKDRVAQTGSIRIPLKRRQLRGIVVGAVAGCGLILVAAVIARVSHASNEPPPVKSATAFALGNATPPATDHANPPAQPASAPRATTPAPASLPMPSDVPATGTVRLERPAAAGRVWIDGKKLTSTSALVECGTHQVKIGARARVRSVQIPCGGELVLAK